MKQFIRILSLTIRQKNNNLRYKIVYLRTSYSGYDLQTGDEIDNNILQIFAAKQPAQIGWEYLAIHYPNVDLSRYLATFRPKLIPLIISVHIPFESMNMFELDAISNSNQVFPDQHKQITLFHRDTVNESSEDWIFLPTEVRVSANYQIYVDLARTISHL